MISWKVVATGGAVLGVIGIIALTRKETPRSPSRVALIGDSYAVGLGPELTKFIPNLKFEGHVGTNTSQWASSAPACGQCGSWLADFHPTVALVSLGVNDGPEPNPTNYQAIVRELHGIGARVVWIEPPAAVNAPGTRSAIASLGVQTIPATQTPLAADGLHPRSYEAWAHEIAARIGA